MIDMGVPVFNAEEAKAKAAQNFICLVYGGPMSGKTQFITRCKRPLYIVYLDRNPSIWEHLLRANVDFGDEVYPLVIPPPKHYKDLSQEMAQAIIQRIDEFAEKAKSNAKERVAQGEYGGTFAVDGATILKGYLEKAMLGQSVTLGGRPEKGERGWPTTYEYAKPNAALMEFIGSFLYENLDAVFAFEGRPAYKDVWEDGTKRSVKTDAWRTTRPDGVPYTITAEVETLKALERLDPSVNTSSLISKHKVRIAMNRADAKFDNMVLPAMTFDQFKTMMLAPTVGIEMLKNARPLGEVIRAADSGLPMTVTEEE